MARFVEHHGRVNIETDKGFLLAYFDTDGTFVPIFGAQGANEDGTVKSGTKAVTTSFKGDSKATTK